MSSLADLQQMMPGFSKMDGMWRLADPSQKLSYPQEGHALCYAVEESSFWFQHRCACIAQVAARFGIKGVLLDVGGGNGVMSAALQSKDLDPVLIEPGLEGCSNAVSRGIPNVVCSRIEDLDFRVWKADVVGIFDVLEHIKDDGSFLNKIYSALKEDGAVLITVPAYAWLWSGADDFAGHFRRYTLKGLKEKLRQSGFKVVYGTYLFSFLCLPIFLLRSLPYLFKMSKPTDASKELNDRLTMGTGTLNRILSFFRNRELKNIKSGHIAFGTSLCVVARKFNTIHESIPSANNH
jgi:SAM-dependent methyltransferase